MRNALRLAGIVTAEKLERDQLYPRFAENAVAAGDKRAADVFERRQPCMNSTKARSSTF
jgi:hypothetical protein